MLLQIFLLIVGLVLLIQGADWLVKGASALAKKYNVSDLAIGLTIVAFGTSTPELVVNVISSMQKHSDIVLGNVIGSNNFNLFIILGIAGVIAPLAVQSTTVWKEIPFSLLAVVILYFIANSFLSVQTIITRVDGVILLGFFIIFLLYIYKNLKKDKASPEIQKEQLSQIMIFTFIVLGLAGLIFGGNLLVSNAIKLAKSMGMSEKLIGLTIVAAGTSMPELATSVVAAIKKNNDIAVGNIIGSNIFNVFLILGASSLIHPIQYNLKFNMDIYLLAGGTIFLFVVMFTGQKKKLDRWEALLLLLFYIIYTSFIIVKGS